MQRFTVFIMIKLILSQPQSVANRRAAIYFPDS